MIMGTKDSISDSLNVEFEQDVSIQKIETDAKEISQKVSSVPSKFDESGVNEDELARDYEYARTNYYELIERGKDALEGILDLAQDSQQPRAYEVAALVIKTLTDANKEIMGLQKNVQNINNESAIKNQTNNFNNALFVGSTKELLDIIKGKNLPEENE